MAKESSNKTVGHDGTPHSRQHLGARGRRIVKLRVAEATQQDPVERSKGR